MSGGRRLLSSIVLFPASLCRENGGGRCGERDGGSTAAAAAAFGCCGAAELGLG